MNLPCRICRTPTPFTLESKGFDRYRCPTCKAKVLAAAGAAAPEHCGGATESEAQLDYDIARCSKCHGIILVEYDITYVDTLTQQTD